MDLGSGDGRTVITAAKRGVRALGVEYNPDMVELSKRNAQKVGVA
jgi:cyclopropane fatty-acyl-phospholipid synthase-like methyltransferase